MESFLELLRKTLGGLVWAYTSHFGRRFMSLLTTAILTRMLVPEEFGLVAAATILITFIESLRGFGINDALIYIDKDIEDASNTAYVMNIVLGCFQYLIAFIFAPLASDAFSLPGLVDVIRVLSLVFIINGFGQTHDALLQKELKFRSRFVPELIATTIKSVVAILLAFLGFGVWSIIFGQVVGAFSQTVAKWFALAWVPKFRFYGTQAILLWQYGVQVLLFTLLGVALEQADQFFIGVMVGPIQLGYYSVAARIPEIVIANFSLVLTKALFPAYAKLQNDIPALAAGFIMTTSYTAYITIPAGIGMASIAPEIVPLIFGNQWTAAIPLFQVLSLLGMVATLPWSAGDVFKAIGRPDMSTRLLFIEAIYTFPMIFFLVQLERTAVAASFANLMALCITTVLRLGVVSRFLKISPFIFVRKFFAPFLAAGIMALGIYALRQALQSINFMPIAIVPIAVVAGGVIYITIMALLEKQEILKIRSNIGMLRKVSDTPGR
jgi:O-antigen/teichoic acid export membrane protein